LAEQAYTPRYWAVIPAAGVGVRMGAASPKQYLTLRGRTVLEHSLARISAHPRITATVLVIAENDREWPRLAENFIKSSLFIARGGAERCHSVLNGLHALADRISPQDWVVVHDAARPCLRTKDIDALLEQLQGHAVGGLLGIPVTDTIKRSDEQGNVIATVQRDGLWHALTPQMFRYQILVQALQAALDKGKVVTDEAVAIELAGFTPRMVEGHADNIKITRPQDLVLADLYLQQQERV
jgi:2-C-methyl-D-erythritol 4-phosphate cytidylyltransferase